MPSALAAAALILGVAVLGLMWLTAAGERQRRRGLGIAVVAGLFFPVTWTVWYLRDAHPYQRTNHG
jgi:hypothetical protein